MKKIGRNSIRLRKFDYNRPGAYFITICTNNREELFGSVSEGDVLLSEGGKLIYGILNDIPKQFEGIELDEFIVMPDHIHAIVFIKSEAELSLFDAISRIKSFTTTQYIEKVKTEGWPRFDERLWQRNYYERIVRSDDEMRKLIEYIRKNPLNWEHEQAENISRRLFEESKNSGQPQRVAPTNHGDLSVLTAMKDGGSKNRRGFTLMEMLIALAILASALSVLMGTMANTGQQSAYAADLTTATLLARSKMIDIEYEVMAEGFSTIDQKYSGTFSEEGRPDMKWSATVTTVQIPDEAREALLANVNSQLFGQKSEGLKGNAAFSSMLPTLIGQLPQMINQIGSKVRRVELKVEFMFGNGMKPVNVSQYIVDPNTKDFNVFGDLNVE